MLSQVLYCAQTLTCEEVLPHISLIEQKFEEDIDYKSSLQGQLHCLLFKALPMLSANNYQSELLLAFLTEVDMLFRYRVDQMKAENIYSSVTLNSDNSTSSTKNKRVSADQLIECLFPQRLSGGARLSGGISQSHMML